jgi:hypothetical protein
MVTVVPLISQVRVVQLRAQWKYTAFGSGESSWSFIVPLAEADPLVWVYGHWQSHLQDLYLAERPGWFELQTVRVEDRYPGTMAPIVNEVSLGATSGEGGDGLPPQVTPIISWRTGNIGRQNRGRTYMGPYQTTACRETDILSPAQDAVYAFADAMIAHFTDVTPGEAPAFAIVSRVRGTDPPTDGHYALVTEYQFWTRWGIMRRRLNFRWAT